MYSFVSRSIAGLLLAVTLAGCMPESKEPLAPISAALAEPRLVGTWMAKIEDDTVYLRIRQRDGNLLDIANFSVDENGKDTLVYYSAHVTEVGGKRFANLREIGSSSGNYFFASYGLDGSNRLVVRFVAEKAVIDAVKAGRLKGKVTESSVGDDVEIDDEPARLAAFLTSTEPSVLFDKPLTFRRTAKPR